MCGICGELRFDGGTPKAETLSRMNEKLARRGPDDEGVHISGPLGFGHRRLSVIDLSERSHQPMYENAANLATQGLVTKRIIRECMSCEAIGQRPNEDLAWFRHRLQPLCAVHRITRH